MDKEIVRELGELTGTVKGLATDIQDLKGSNEKVNTELSYVRQDVSELRLWTTNHTNTLDHNLTNHLQAHKETAREAEKRFYHRIEFWGLVIAILEVAAIAAVYFIK